MIPRIHGEWTVEAIQVVGVFVQEAEELWEVSGCLCRVDVLIWRSPGASPSMADVEEIILWCADGTQLAVLGRHDLAWYRTELEKEPLQLVIEREIQRKPQLSLYWLVYRVGRGRDC